MIIILDGPEKVGKTTLAKAIIHRRPDFHYRHWSTSWPDEIEFRFEEAQYNFRHEIWDRCFISERVYTKLLSRSWNHPLFKPGRIQHLTELFNSAYLWILTGNTKRMRRLKDLTDLPVDPEEEQGLYLRYGIEAKATVLDVDSMPTYTAVDTILSKIEEN